MLSLAMQGNLVDAGSDMMKLGSILNGCSWFAQSLVVSAPPRRSFSTPRPSSLSLSFSSLIYQRMTCRVTATEINSRLRPCDLSHSNDESSSDVLGMIRTCKISDEGSRELTRTGCCPSCYCGSPPLVHLLSPLPLSKICSKMDDGFSF